MAAGYDDWPCEPIRKLIQTRTWLNVVPIPQTFRGMTAGVTELVVATGPERAWHGNPVAACFDVLLKSATHAATLTGSDSTRLTATRWRELARKHAPAGEWPSR